MQGQLGDMCNPLAYGGPGVLNTNKFTQALRLRWPWYEWKESSKLWVGMGNPCDEVDLDFFYSSTSTTVGNGVRTPFWDSPWVLGRKPKDIAPLNFEASSRKKGKVRESLMENAWIAKIKLTPEFSWDQIHEFVVLWSLIYDFQLDSLVEDDILWKHIVSGHYSAASTYKAQNFREHSLPYGLSGVEGLPLGQILRVASNTRYDLDGRPVGKERVAKLRPIKAHFARENKNPDLTFSASIASCFNFGASSTIGFILGILIPLHGT